MRVSETLLLLGTVYVRRLRDKDKIKHTKKSERLFSLFLSSLLICVNYSSLSQLAHTQQLQPQQNEHSSQDESVRSLEWNTDNCENMCDLQ